MKRLITPDTKRCQAEKPNGQTVFTLGGGPKLVRCDSKPDVIAIEKRKGEDGRRGSMSLCFKCAKVLEKQMPDHANYIEIAIKKDAPHAK